MNAIALPPDGHTFVDFHGEMPKARIEGAVSADKEHARDDLEWLGSPTAVEMLATQAAAAQRDWSFGWIRLADGADQNELARALDGTGAEIVGSSGHLIRARLPGDVTRLQAIAKLPAVDGLGATPPQAKLKGFRDDGGNRPIYEQTPVYVTLMTDDTDGRWRVALEELGAVVGRYDPDIRFYTANVTYDLLLSLAAADFVLAVEPIGTVKATHDTTVPAMGADALRMYTGSPGIFSGTGGASVPIAVMDTGLNISHMDIASHRDSICGANFAYNSGWFGPDGSLLETEDLWIDESGHGTHVTGTIAGNGYVESRFTGMAPSVRHIRFAKVLDVFGQGFGDSVQRGMDFLAETSGCNEAGVMSARVKPLIVNMSLSNSTRIFEGRSAGERKLDAIVWNHRQLYVVAQGNNSVGGFSNFGAAKNSLAIGAVMDSGELAGFSSHGPTADGRLAPNLVATGVDVYSAKGGGSLGEYIRSQGTSMSSPTVAGVAVLLMDAVPAHREQPALTRARLMASAIRPDVWLEDAALFPTNNSTGPGTLQAQYGMGKASARTSALNRDQADGWTSGGAIALLTNGEYAYQDIVVPEGASRLDLVMTWDEPPADTIASTVLNDLDLWLDRDGDCGTEACGEHVSASRVDNVEWVIVRNPQPGTYRAKILAHRIYTEAPRAALAWTVIRGDSTPNLTIEADKDVFEILEGEQRKELTLTLSSDGYVAAGTRLHIDCRDDADSSGCNDVTLETLAVSREDGVLVDPSTVSSSPVPRGYGYGTKPFNLGTSIKFGEVSVDENQEITFLVSYSGDQDPARLHFTASAWNARASSVSVALGSDSGTESDATHPANDDFAAAMAIEGMEGSIELDLLLATPEPGEPVFGSREGRPAGSVWYEWTAPANGLVHFNVPALPRPYQVARIDRIDVYSGDRFSMLEEVASGLWGTSFFAEEGQTYRVRVSSFSRGDVLELHWSPGAPPVNDDFANATELEGDTGSVEGNSRGATLEPGEWFGRLSATTWFRSTAPSDGDWTFLTDNSRSILVFEGDSIATLRMVSGYPSSFASFPARSGQEYRIVVAEASADASSGPYKLDWYYQTWFSPNNDSFANAYLIGNAASEQHIGIDTQSTVEPGEPVETGVRTNWWVWEAPSDGLYTWRLGDLGEAVPTYPKLRVTLFTGTSIDDLQLVAETGPGAPFDFVLDATDGQQYWIAAGLPVRDVSNYQQRNASAKLVWGLTPDNDNLANASMLTGATGSNSGSNSFATTERGQRTTILGRSTLWWDYEAPASGWYRLSVEGTGGPWALTVQRGSIDGFGAAEIIGSSRWQRIESALTEVLFYAAAGSHYAIALGVHGAGTGGEFTLSWEETEPPEWLRYAGQLADGNRDSLDNPIEIRGPGNLAFHDNGDKLYFGSSLGLHVFERQPATGELNFLQLLDGDLQRSSLIWDSHRTRLLADECGTWRSFSPVGSSTELEDLGELTVVRDPKLTVIEDPGFCGDQLLMDSGGSFIYRLRRYSGVELFAVEPSGDLRLVERYNKNSVSNAVISSDGEFVYVVSYDNLLVFERDADSGKLTQTDFKENIMSRIFRPPLAISNDGTFLFVFGQDGRSTNVFSLESPAIPQRLATLPPFWNPPPGPNRDECHFADVRNDIPVVDVFCHSAAFTAKWNPSSNELTGTDYIANWLPDRFNNHVPDFGFPVDMAASPDGKHVYLSTPEQGILIFGRGAPVVSEESGDPDLVVHSPSVNNSNPAAGGAFTLNAVVRNLGDGRSAATMLRYYRSTNTSISVADTEVGSTPVGSLESLGSSGRSISLTAPTDPGTYHYGACVDTVVDESDDTNNCSNAVTITVSGIGESGSPDLVVQSPSVSNNSPVTGESFTLSVVVRNQGDGQSTTNNLRYYQSNDTTISGEDTEVGTDTISVLPATATSIESINLMAPETAGTYHYGACVDTVTDESDDTNNCSIAVTITVSETLEPVSPDLVVESPSVSNNSPVADESFTLSVVVRNQGDGLSTATDLRFYRSDDTTISAEDTEVGTNTVSSLTASASSDHTISLTAPSSAGTYYYGACVDAVSSESDTTNNCSAAVTVTVTNVGSGLPEDFDLDADNRNPVGIAYALNGFHVVDSTDDKVYGYGMSGERNAASDFDLDSDNRIPEAIVYANDRFYVFDVGYDKAYAYRMSGERDTTADFELDADNSFTAGVTYANDRFYVVDLTDDKVYVYHTSGQRDSTSDFELAGENSYPYGMASANDRIYVIDRVDRKTYVYSMQGERVPDLDFDLDADNSLPNSITIVNGRIYVLDNSDDKVYAYP